MCHKASYEENIHGRCRVGRENQEGHAPENDQWFSYPSGGRLVVLAVFPSKGTIKKLLYKD